MSGDFDTVLPMGRWCRSLQKCQKADETFPRITPARGSYGVGGYGRKPVTVAIGLRREGKTMAIKERA